MANLNEIARQFGGQEDPIKKTKEVYEPVTAIDMAKATSIRITEAIEAARSEEPLAPMVRKLFSGYRVKVGYGNRNEKIAGLDEQHFPSLNTVADYLSAIKELMDNGECNANFQVLLESYRKRAEAGKIARRQNRDTALAA